MEWAAASLQPQGSQCWIFDRGTLLFYLHALTCLFWGRNRGISFLPKHTNTLSLSNGIEHMRCKNVNEPLLFIFVVLYMISFPCCDLSTSLKCTIQVCTVIFVDTLSIVPHCFLSKLLNAATEFKHRKPQTNSSRTNRTHTYLCIERLT